MLSHRTRRFRSSWARPAWSRVTLLVLLALVLGTYVSERARMENVIRMMSGWTIILDPGHGGIDPGAIGRTGVEEEDIVLAIAFKLKRILESDGVRVVLTRETDTDLSSSGGGAWVRQDMRRRVEIANENIADVVLSIHCNAMPSPQWHGAQVFYDSGKNPLNRGLAECIQGEITRLVGGTDRLASFKINHYILKNVDVPSATVEVGFLSNPREEALLARDEYQQSLAWGIFAGVLKFAAMTRNVSSPGTLR